MIDLEIITIMVLFGILMFLMLYGIALIWIRETQGRSILLSLLFTLGVLAAAFILTFGLLFNWSIIWKFIVFITDNWIIKRVGIVLLILALGYLIYSWSEKNSSEYMDWVEEQGKEWWK